MTVMKVVKREGVGQGDDTPVSLNDERLKEEVLEIRAHYEGEAIAGEIYFVMGKMMHAFGWQAKACKDLKV